MTESAVKYSGAAEISSGRPYRVMLVDDSATVRGLMRNWLSEQDDIVVVASCANGLQAIQNLESHKPEIIILDIEMPVMDGITALPELLKAAPNVVVIIASTLTTRNAQISLKALSMGAVDYITKPVSSHGLAGSEEFKRSILEKVRAFGEKGRVTRGEDLPEFDAGKPAKVDQVAREALSRRKPQRPDDAYELRKPSSAKPEIIAIGASTGGPQALLQVLKSLTKESLPPIMVAQHMPKTFTTILAQHLTKMTSLSCHEARDGQLIEAGNVYIAPGDYHMLVSGTAGHPVVRLTQTAPENFCRPSLDPLFRSISKMFGDKALSIMLTGMGSDGLEGTRQLVEAGGTMIAQNEETSVVWGMPGSVANAGLCAKILPLAAISPAIKSFI